MTTQSRQLLSLGQSIDMCACFLRRTICNKQDRLQRRSDGLGERPPAQEPHHTTRHDTTRHDTTRDETKRDETRRAKTKRNETGQSGGDHAKCKTLIGWPMGSPASDAASLSRKLLSQYNNRVKNSRDATDVSQSFGVLQTGKH